MEHFSPGRLVNQGYYKAFVPSEINRKWTITDEQLLHLLSKADQRVGRLDAYANYVDVDRYINLHIAKEATESSKIEGTRTEVRESFFGLESVDRSRRADWEEVRNYITAMNEAVASLARLPFSSRLFRQAHNVLMQGAIGQSKQPGEYRKSQN